MSEIQRYLVDPIRLDNPSTARAVYVVGAADFDAVQTNNVQLSEAHRVAQKQLGDLWKELDAQRLRADTAEAELAKLRYKAELYDEVRADATGRGYANVTMALCALAAAEQRIAELSTALRRAKLWVEDRRRFGDYGTIAEDWLMIERTLRELPHPPSEFDASFNPNPEAESHE